MVNEDGKQICPLKDDSGSCVDFLSKPDEKLIEVDVNALKGRSKDEIRRKLFHRGIPLGSRPDPMDQYSNELNSIVERYLNDIQQIDLPTLLKNGPGPL